MEYDDAYLNYLDDKDPTNLNTAGLAQNEYDDSHLQLSTASTDKDHALFNYYSDAPPPSVLEDAGVLRMRRFCTIRGITGWKGKTKQQLVQHIPMAMDKRKQLATVIQTVTATVPSPTSGVSSRGALSLAERRVLKWNREFRTLNVLYSQAIYPKWLASASKATRADLDGKRIGNRADVWQLVATELNSVTPNPAYDELVPRTQGGIHPFLQGVGINPGPLPTNTYQPADVYASWKDIQSDFKAKMGRFNVSGNHELNEESFKHFLKPNDKTTFYLYQWTLDRPDSLCFASATLDPAHVMDTTSGSSSSSSCDAGSAGGSSTAATGGEGTGVGASRQTQLGGTKRRRLHDPASLDSLLAETSQALKLLMENDNGDVEKIERLEELRSKAALRAIELERIFNADKAAGLPCAAAEAELARQQQTVKRLADKIDALSVLL
eukprot:GHVU01202038.1.p1 GENE.GHVU01202038.1~~GHVU01202038.1.p1  ORF type:complete len:438 (-),score=64.99 GHVU01202038.1:771-2084(-)